MEFIMDNVLLLVGIVVSVIFILSKLRGGAKGTDVIACVSGIIGDILKTILVIVLLIVIVVPDWLPLVDELLVIFVISYILSGRRQ